VASLAFPFMVNSAVQAVLNATDTWFIGRVIACRHRGHWRRVLARAGLHAALGRRGSRGSDAGGASLRRPPVCAGIAGHLDRVVGLAVYGAGIALLALAGAKIFGPFGLPAEIERLALMYWVPRMMGGPLSVALWAVLGFFNGIGRPTVTLRIAAGVAVINALLNQLFMFNLGMGVAGSAWATNAAQLIGLSR